MKNLIYLTIFALFCSCSLMTNRSYLHEMEDQEMNVALFQPHRDFKVVGGDASNGHRSREEVLKRTPGNTDLYAREKSSLKSELRELESKTPEDVLYDYNKIKLKLSSDSERIYYLKLNTTQERLEYLELKGLGNSLFYTQGEEELAARYREITLGMNKFTVSRSWGKPHRVEVAGNPRLENERWSYFLNNGRTRYIYFERGRVEGWSEED